jgi:hypothetical protein
MSTMTNIIHYLTHKIYKTAVIVSGGTVGYYKKQGYTFMSRENIYKSVVKILNNNL